MKEEGNEGMEERRKERRKAERRRKEIWSGDDLR